MANRKTSLRPSRDEREPYITAINEALVDGRIGTAEQAERVTAAEGAESFDTLDGLVADIPFHWEDETLEKEQRRLSRRRLLSGAAGVVLIGAASYFVTDRVSAGISGAAESSAESSAESTTDPAQEPTPEGSVPTDLVEVRLWQKDTMPTAIGAAADAGLTRFAAVRGSGDTLSVTGRTKEGTGKVVNFAKGSAPAVDDDDAGGTKFADAEKLRKVDLKKLHDEVASDLAEDVAEHSLDISWDLGSEEFVIGIRDFEHSFRWSLDTLKRLEDGTV